MAEKGTGLKIIIGFIALLIGVVLIGTLATESLARTSYLTVSGESEAYTITGDCPNVATVHTVTNNPTDWKTQDCPISSLVVVNASTGGTALTETTDYTLTASAGTFLLKNSTATRLLVSSNKGATNTTYLSYSYCGDDYLNSSWGRTAVNMVPGFFAIALLLIAVGLFYGVAKENGIV